MSERESGTCLSAPLISDTAPDGRLYAPTFERNGGPIRAVIDGLLAGVPGAVVEIGCGSGQHSATLAAAHPDRTFLPTDIVDAHRASASAHAAAAKLSNVMAPRALDAADDWADDVADLAPIAMVMAINVVHISPWSVAEGLFRDAGRALRPGGHLALYGPFRKNDEPMVPSNVAFDESLRARDPRWGIRAIDDLDALASASGLRLHQEAVMPANNLVLAWQRC